MLASAGGLDAVDVRDLDEEMAAGDQRVAQADERVMGLAEVLDDVPGAGDVELAVGQVDLLDESGEHRYPEPLGRCPREVRRRLTPIGSNPESRAASTKCPAAAPISSSLPLRR